MVEAVMPMTLYVTENSTLSPSQRLLLALRTAWLDGSEAVWASIAARGAGQHGPVASFDRRDASSRSLLRLADEMVLTSSVSGATWASLASEHDSAGLMDAVETVAHISFLSCLARSFGVPADGLQAADPPTGWPGGPERPDIPVPGRLPTVARIQPVDGGQIAVRRTFANHPTMDAARQPRADFVNRISPLSAHDRETLILRIGWDCRSEYEWAKHVGSVGRARDHGVDPSLVAAGPTAPGVSARDAVLMRVADELYRDSMVSDLTWDTVLEEYGLYATMAAIFTASSYRSTSMSLNAYCVQLDPGDEGFQPEAG
jgi:alkylhydroperoxidase family enzyme